ncbi:MAG: hypothetical protein FGF48_05555 [Candidatus Brockarchaeota archaeon]|nr:hypothetical protein [Candidatus Brockarchaeota archaeon]
MEQAEARRRLLELVEKFREKGATSPDKAMTPEEIGLPPWFRRLMRGRLGKLGVFVEKEGKYYLSEERLKQLEKRRGEMLEARNARRNLFMLRIARVTVGILLVSLLLVNIYVMDPSVRIVYSILLIALLAISILQLYYLTKASRVFRPTENRMVEFGVVKLPREGQR